MKRLIAVVLLLASVHHITTAATDKRSMNIRLTIRGLENSTMILANYFGDKQYVKDTFDLDKKGSVTLKADTMLPGGIYLAVFPALGNRYFEFVVSETNFALETDTLDMALNMKVTNSPENKLFYDDMKFLANKKREADSLNTLYKSEKDAAKKETYKNGLMKIDTAVKAQREYVVKNFPQMLYAKIVLSMKDVEVPDPPRDANGKIIDSTFQWQYFKNHFWDYFDLKDERLLRCPVLHNKLKYFFEKLVVQHPDSIISAVHWLLAKTDGKNDVYRYILTEKFNEAANSKVMGMDAVYVDLGATYFCSGKTPWIDTVKEFKICDRVKRMEPVLIGKKARNIFLADSTLKKYYALYDLKNKYTILAFWDPDCGHCKKEIPLLATGYHNLKKMGIDVECFSPAIMEIEEVGKWKEFIQKNNLDWINVADPYRQNNFRFEWDIQSTPQIYVLDKDKKILARRMSADQVEDYIRHLEDPSFKPKSLFKVGDEEKQEEAH